jgi:SpoVK/Ycf46/Vps4 family AAA+-type ATPase
MAAIHNIRPALTDLKRMIGMKNLKNAIIDQVIYFIQNLHKNDKCAGNDFMHTVIYGPPGTGKTEVAKIMGRIFAGVGVLEKEKFKKVTRVDLVAGYLGQTAIKTNQVVKDCLGGVLFIDEAYALGNDEKRDSFSKECIDTLCEALSNHKDNLMVIIAGYKDDLDKCFFAYNKGLDSRFPWRFETNNYSPDELNLIFQKKVVDIGWSLGHTIPRSWFSSKMKHFTFYGRDMETLLSKVKIAHSRRVFCKEVTEKTIITQRDMNRGFEMFLCNSGNNRTKDIDKYIQESLYL